MLIVELGPGSAVPGGVFRGQLVQASGGVGGEDPGLMVDGHVRTTFLAEPVTSL